MGEQHDISPTSIVENHSDYLLSFAMSKLNDLELSKDLVQDALLAAITKLDTFEKRSQVRTWLTSILQRKIIDHWRKAETKYTDPVSSFFDNSSKKHHWLEEKQKVDEPSVLDKLSKAETIEELNECIDKLPQKWKGIIASKYLDEKESDEICNEFNITPSNLWVIIHRAKLVLRDCLNSTWNT